MAYTCQECGKGPTCDAHIVARGFARLIADTNNHVLEISQTGAKKAKRQHGFFDGNILCAECDREIGKLDDLAISYCRDFVLPQNITPYQPLFLPKFDTAKMCRFAISVVWRASISSIPQFNDIKLGPYEDVARDLIFGRIQIQSCKELHLQVNVLTSPFLDMKSHIGLPIQVRNECGPYVIFSAGSLQWLVRFGGTKFGSGGNVTFASQLALNSNDKPVAVAYPFSKSADYNLYQQAAKALTRRNP
jgi:hypothetical protein